MSDKIVLNWQQPAVSLLPELLSQIFVFVLRDLGNADPQHINSTHIHRMRQTRLMLCAICSRWREVALSTQVLWSILSFPPNYNDDVDAKTSVTYGGETLTPISVEFFAEEVKRSGQSPLSLYLLISARDSLGNTIWPLISVSNALVNTVEPLLPRCRHLHFWGDKNPFFRIINHINVSPTPVLQSLSISLHPDSVHPRERVIDLSQAHYLSEVRIHGDYDEEISNERAIPLQLKLSAASLPRRVEIDESVNIQNILTLFTQSSSLEEFYWMSSDRRFDIPHTPLPPIPHLRHLILSARIPPTLLEYLDAPALVRLETNFPWELDSVYPLPLSSTRNFPNLRALVLGGHQDTIRDHDMIIVRLIQSHPSLQIVSLPGHITEIMAETLATLPSLGHVSANLGYYANNTAGLTLLLRRWRTAATVEGLESSQQFAPTIYLTGGFVPRVGATPLVQDEDLTTFAQQRFLESSPFLNGQTSGAYWDELINESTYAFIFEDQNCKPVVKWYQGG
ncbi:hypothetical protein DL93DRAFT_2155403 [Clavulina sp. PMI_390]|nr:hypothetical protein DL93DRAFT_2155403 [Clavulina sp. PMI_390]